LESHLFVYGSLRKPARNTYASALHRASRFVGPATVRAKLYRIGSYAAMVCSSGCRDSVNGQVFRLRDPEERLDSLDFYEGVAYRRTMVIATTLTGKCIRCWAYLYRFRIRQ
jgi:gamma-glutamylcyclotransferase (GGCT)/AIG2-like uncharacterized protein YtfP